MSKGDWSYRGSDWGLNSSSDLVQLRRERSSWEAPVALQAADHRTARVANSRIALAVELQADVRREIQSQEMKMEVA